VTDQLPPMLAFSEVIPAPLAKVWEAWTTEDGTRSFFAPECRLELIPGGSYEMYFNLDSPVGEKGGEGCKILAIDPPFMLSFTWNAPPELPAIRSQYTHVVIRLSAINESETLVQLTHDGWGVTPEWKQGIAYFQSAWGESASQVARQVYQRSDGLAELSISNRL